MVIYENKNIFFHSTGYPNKLKINLDIFTHEDIDFLFVSCTWKSFSLFWNR